MLISVLSVHRRKTG